jgi:hypothetical protein
MAIPTLAKSNQYVQACYTAVMAEMTISQFASLGGKARAAKLSAAQFSVIGKKGGRPVGVRRDWIANSYHKH